MKIDVQLYITLLEQEVNRLKLAQPKGVAAYLGTEKEYTPPKNLVSIPGDNVGTDTQ